MDYRIERDTLGEMKVPTDKLWGAQTQRSYENFPIGTEKMPMDVIRAFAMLKKGAALANRRLNNLEPEKAEAIAQAADEKRKPTMTVRPRGYFFICAAIKVPALFPKVMKAK